jgi:hypothetical protein
VAGPVPLPGRCRGSIFLGLLRLKGVSYISKESGMEGVDGDKEGVLERGMWSEVGREMGRGF